MNDLRDKGEVAEWSKAADCKSAGDAYVGSNPALPILYKMKGYINLKFNAGVAQLAGASAFQAEGRGFESRLPLKGCYAHVAQPVEHILGKDEVSGSSPLVGSLCYKKLELANT